jgi:hypothetical protein
MSCQLTQNIPIDTCKSNIGGIKSIFVMPFQNISGSVTVSSGSVTAIPIQSGSGFQYWRHDFRKETSTYKDDLKISDQNASVYSDQSITCEFTRVEIIKRNELTLLAQSDLSMIVLDNLGQYWLYGATNGMVPNNLEGDSGKKYGDGSKYKLSFKGVEPTYAYIVPSTMIAGLTAPH